MPIELVALIAYLIVLLVIGLRSAREVKTSTDYALAGRSVGWTVILATTAASMVGGGASVGAVSQVFATGIGYALVTFAWHLQLVFMGVFVAPRLRRLNLITVGDYFELKFGPIARNLAVFHCAIFLIGALTAQSVAMGAIANAVLGIDYEWGVIIGASVMIFYSTVGGMPAVVKTDVLQFVILVVGIASAAGLLFVKAGGFTGMYERLGPEPFNPLTYGTPTELITLFIAFFLGEMFVPPYTMRCFIAKDARHARWGIAIAGVFLILFLPAATFIIGTAAQMDPEISAAVGDEPQRAFPALIRVTFHPLFAGVMIAALVAAVMSSADSVLSSSATVVMEDLYRRYYKPAATDRELLNVARWSTLLVGVGATGLAFLFQDITDILKFVYDFWGAGMVLPFLIGLFWYRRERVPAVVVSMVVALVATPLWQLLDNPYGFSAAFFGLLAALTAFFVTLCFLPSGSRGAHRAPEDHG